MIRTLNDVLVLFCLAALIIGFVVVLAGAL